MQSKITITNYYNIIRILFFYIIHIIINRISNIVPIVLSLLHLVYFLPQILRFNLSAGILLII